MGGVGVRLGYVCQYFTQDYRGPVTNLLDELSKDIEVCNYSSAEKHMQYYGGGVHEEKTEKVSDNLVLRRYENRLKISGLLFPRNLMELISEDRPDILQSEEYYQPASHQAFRYARRNGIPFIFNHRGSEPRTRTLRERLFFNLANPLSKGLVRDSNAIVCLSQSGKNVISGVYPGVEGKTHVIPNSIDPDAYSGADGGKFRMEHGVPSDIPLLLCVARLHPQKRVDLLVRSFAMVKEDVRDSMLCVVGPWFESEKKKIDSLISDLGLDDVVFTGSIPNERVKDAYAAADVVALTSEYEPFGYCLLEAMAQSKPVVAFDIGAVSEIVEDGVTGYVSPFPDTEALASKAISMFEDGALSKKMGSNALERVRERFLLSENAARLVGLYEELLEYDGG
ncbi:MAG: glycosyltransferase [Candidatus Altiarchaeales archaeon]|nr:glycosyltransferase [Candidatus Altiarchaeales archaeon]MBD3415629.1 glycosyltransferase [Candidatus Altiarchaeales archaeon]